MRADRRFALLLSCFFVSGLAALIYETAWTRQFAFVFGTSELAVATVLAGYMGGLAAGAALAARWAGRIRRPILAYALIELGIAVSALAIPLAIAGSRRLYVAVFGGGLHLADEGGLLRFLFYLACSFVILLVPTGLMGATLPLLARHAVRSDEQLGSRIGLLYSANTLGAVCGTVTTAFVLLPRLGLRGSIWAAVGANVLVFAAAAALARRAPAVDVEKPEAGHALGLRLGRDRFAWILPMMLASGAASLAYEVLWTRLLGHLLGGSVYAFATMLAAFLAGIALGSAVASRIAANRWRSTRAFAWAQIGAAGLSVVAFVAIDWMPQVARALSGAAGGTTLAGAAVAAATLLPGTLFIGATFPLAVRMLAEDETEATAASARVFSWNTTGAILGAVGAGFFVIPALGFAGTLTVCAAVNLALALAAAAMLPQRRIAWIAAAGLLVVAFVRPPQPWNLLRSSPFLSGPASGRIVHYSIGRTATVAMHEDSGAWRLRSNGLPEAVVQPPGDRRSRYTLGNWLGALPSLARPQARRMMVVGLGGGTILEAVPGSITEIETVEIEAEIIAANRAIAERRARDPLADPRLTLIVNDARDALTLSSGLYGVIVSHPSHPWTEGAAHLYTREYFELARRHLAADGVFAQWIGLRFVDDELLRTLVATLADVFEHVRAYRPVPTGMVLLGSPAPLDVEANAAAVLAGEHGDYSSLGILCPADVAAGLVLDDAAARAFAAGAPINTDNRNLLAMRSPGLIRRSVREYREPIDAALAEHDPLLAPTPGVDRVAVVRRLLRSGFAGRAERVAQATRDPGERATAMSLVALAGDDQAVDAAFEAVGADPAILEARALERAGDIEAIKRLDPALAEVDPCDPFYLEVVRLRVAWRLAGGDPADARQALELLDPVLDGGTIHDFLTRARAAAAAGEIAGAVATLHEVRQRLAAMPVRHDLLREVLDAVEEARRRAPYDRSIARMREQMLAAINRRGATMEDEP